MDSGGRDEKRFFICQRSLNVVESIVMRNRRSDEGCRAADSEPRQIRLPRTLLWEAMEVVERERERPEPRFRKLTGLIRWLLTNFVKREKKR